MKKKEAALGTVIDISGHAQTCPDLPRPAHDRDYLLRSMTNLISPTDP